MKRIGARLCNVVSEHGTATLGELCALELSRAGGVEHAEPQLATITILDGEAVLTRCFDVDQEPPVALLRARSEDSMKTAVAHGNDGTKPAFVCTGERGDGVCGPGESYCNSPDCSPPADDAGAVPQ